MRKKSREPKFGFDIKRVLWAAGFLEGEGSFFFNVQGCLVVAAAQAQREPLLRLQKIFGGAIYRQGKKPRKPNWKQIWQWRVIRWHAAEVAMTLYSLMSPERKKQIRRALKKWKGSPSYGDFRRKWTHCPKGHSYSKENTYINKSKSGRPFRQCRTCKIELQKIRRDVQKGI